MDFTDVIKQKSTDELLEIHKAYNDYQKEFILQVEKELSERDVSFLAVDSEEFKKQEEQEEIEKEKKAQSVVITQEYLKENTKIRGWLTLFLIVIAIGGIFSAVYSLATTNLSEYEGSDKLLAFADVLNGFLICGLAIFTIISFINRRPDAVFLGKTYIIVVFLTNLIVFLLGEYRVDTYGSVPHLIRSMVWSVIWFCFLCFSNQVQEVIPNEYRKRTRLDYILIAVMVFIPLFAFVFAFCKEYRAQSDLGEYIENTSLKHDEYSDGIVAFTLPQGFECDSNYYEGMKVFQLSHSDEVSIFLASAYDSDRSEKNINQCWRETEDEDLAVFQKEIIVNEKRIVNSIPYSYKVTRYHIGDTYYFWRFILLFDEDSSKMCLISCYDSGAESYVSELLESIRFS